MSQSDSLNQSDVDSNGVLNVRARLARQNIWRKEHAEEEALLYAQLRELDPGNPTQRVRARAIVNEIQRIEWKIVKEPLQIDPDAIQNLGVDGYRKAMAVQFASLTKDERKLWLDNLRFLMTP